MKLGSLILGQKVKKQVNLVNRSSLDLSFTLLLNTPLDPRVENTHTHTDTHGYTRNSSLHESFPLLLLQDLSFSPAGELSLKASGGSCTVEIQFSPRQHIPPFTAELQAECAGLLHPLLTIQGCCQVGCEVHFILQGLCK